MWPNLMFGTIVANKPILEALKSKSEAKSELSVKKRRYLMIQIMFGRRFAKILPLAYPW